METILHLFVYICMCHSPSKIYTFGKTEIGKHCTQTREKPEELA